MNLTFGQLLVGVAGVATVLGVMAIAAIQAAHQFQELNNSLILSGNFAGTTTSGLNSIAHAAASTGGSLSAARTIVAEFAATGRFTAEQIALITPALVELEHATGKTVEPVSDAFKHIAEAAENTTSRSADAVTRAVLSMNSTYHLLSTEQVTQIANMEAQGKALDAVGIAFSGMTDTIRKRSHDATEDFTALGKVLDGMKKSAESTWDSLVKVFSVRMPDKGTQLKDAISQLNVVTINGDPFGQTKNLAIKIAQLQKEMQVEGAAALEEGKKKQLEIQQQYAERSVALMIKQNNSQSEAMRKITDLDESWAKSSDAYKLAHLQEYEDTREKLIKASQEKVKKIRAEGTSAIDAELRAILAASEEKKKALENDVSALDEAYKAQKISVFDYVDQKNTLLLKEQANTTDTRDKEYKALNDSIKQHNYNATELNVIAGKRSEITKQSIDAYAKEGKALEANGNLISDIASKSAAAQAESDKKALASIQTTIDKLQDKVNAYKNLPDAIKLAGVSEKQIQDSISEATIQRLKDEQAQIIENNNVEEPLMKARLDFLDKQIIKLGIIKNLQTTDEGQQKANSFNLATPARNKSEAAMAVAEWTSAGKEIQDALTASFDNVGKSIGNMFKAYSDSQAERIASEERYQKVVAEQANNPDPTEKARKIALADYKNQADQQRAQVKGFADLAGAAAGFFDKQSKGYKVLHGLEVEMHLLEMAMMAEKLFTSLFVSSASAAGVVTGQVVETGAVVAGQTAQNAAKVPGVFMSFMSALGPWGAAAAAVAIAAVLGGAFSGGSAVDTGSAAYRQKNQGTGSVLGDETAKSDSINKSLEVIAKDSGLGLVHFQSMDTSLKAVVAGLGSLGTSIVQFGGINNLSKDIAGNQSGGWLGSVVNSIFGGNKTVKDAGISIAQNTVGGIATSGANAQSYNDVHTSGGWFSSGSDSRQMTGLGADTNKQISDIITGLANTISAAANQLGVGGSAFEDHLKSFVVDISNLSLKDLTGDEVTKALNAVFSKLGDDMAAFAVDGLKGYQKIGEGYLETLSRVANDLIQTQDVFAVLGKTMNVTGIAAVQVSENFINLFGSVDKFTSAAKYYVDNFKSDAEKVIPVQNSLNDVLAQMGLQANITVDQFKALVDAQDLNSTAGQEMFVKLMNLAPAVKQVADAMDVAAKAASDLTNKSLDMQLTIYNLEGSTGKATAVIAAQRQIELDAMDASLRPMQIRINQLNDEAAASDAAAKAISDAAKVISDAAAAEAKAIADANAIITKAVNDAKAVATSDFNVLKASIDVAKANAKAAYDAQVAITNAQISSLQAVNTEVGNLSSALDSALQTAIDAVGGMSRATAQTLLDNALNTAKSTGKLPTADSMKDVFSALAKDSTSSFSSLQDYQKDAGITAGKIADLNMITKAQKSVNELQLDALQEQLITEKASYDAQVAQYDQILSYAQLQLDAMNNNVIATKSLGDALTAFNASSLHANTLGQMNGSSVPTASATKDQVTSLYQSILGRAPDAAGLAFYTGTGETASSVANSLLHSTEYAGINGSHAGGADNIPFDGYTAKLHKGEMVIPAKKANDVAQGSDLSELKAEIKQLREDNSAENQAIAGALIWMKKLFQNVSPNGQTLQVTQTVIS